MGLELLITKGYCIIFLLNDFEFLLQFPETIFRNLESVLAVNKNRVNFLFFSSVNLLENSILDKLHNFKYAVTQSSYYNELLNQKESAYIFDSIEEKLSVKIGDNLKKLIYELCGGHAQLLKYCTHILKENKVGKIISLAETKLYLLNNHQLKNICFDIWHSLNDFEKEILTKICVSGDIPQSLLPKSDFLVKTGIVKKSEDNHYVIFGQIFDHFIRSQVPKEKIIYDEKTDRIFFGGKSCGDKFTLQEFKMFTYFIKNENKVISRDEMGRILWGKNYIDKYSDWSIDKIISVLRKKLSNIGFSGQKLTTLKRRGFSFSNEI